MSYIYDIVLNFQNNYYQFFEWNRTDKIKNIYKIIVYHVTDKDLLDLTYNQIVVDEQFINEVKEKNKKHKKIMCLVSNTNQTIGLLFSNDGKLLKRSSLLFEEEAEVNTFCKDLPITTICYKKNIKKNPDNRLRIEKEKKDTLVQYINKTNNILILKYLYYEYFKEECTDASNIKESLLNIMKNEWNKKKQKLYQIISILSEKDIVTK